MEKMITAEMLLNTLYYMLGGLVLGSIGIYVVAYLPLKKENKKRENDKK
jgi:hypothetical protein